MDSRGFGQLGHCLNGIFVSGTCQPHWLSGIVDRPIEDLIGSDHVECICALFVVVP